MVIYRIEHIDTELGPFQHGNQEVLGKGISMSTYAFPDLDSDPEVKLILEQYKGNVLFGFNDLDACRSVIIDEKLMEEQGFFISVYYTSPIYVHSSGQVIFLKNKRDI